MKRFLRWLLREDLRAAFRAGQKSELVGIEAEIEARCAVAYARGELAGQERAFDAIDDEVKGRPVTLEDVRAARKRGTH